MHITVEQLKLTLEHLKVAPRGKRKALGHVIMTFLLHPEGTCESGFDENQPYAAVPCYNMAQPPSRTERKVISVEGRLCEAIVHDIGADTLAG